MKGSTWSNIKMKKFKSTKKGFALSDIKSRRFSIIDKNPIIPKRRSVRDELWAEVDRNIFEEINKILRKPKKDLAFTFYFGIM